MRTLREVGQQLIAGLEGGNITLSEDQPVFIALPEDKYGTLNVVNAGDYSLVRAARETGDYWTLSLYRKDAPISGVSELACESIVSVSGLTEQRAKDAAMKFLAAKDK